MEKVSKSCSVRFIAKGEPGPQGPMGPVWAVATEPQHIVCTVEGNAASGQSVTFDLFETVGDRSVQRVWGELKERGLRLDIVQRSSVTGHEGVREWHGAGESFPVNVRAEEFGCRLVDSTSDPEGIVYEKWLPFRVNYADVESRFNQQLEIIEGQKTQIEELQTGMEDQKLKLETATATFTTEIDTLQVDATGYAVPVEAIVTDMGITGTDIRVILNNKSGSAPGFIAEVLTSGQPKKYGTTVPRLTNGSQLGEYGTPVWDDSKMAILYYRPFPGKIYTYEDAELGLTRIKYVEDMGGGRWLRKSASGWVEL